MILFLSDVEDLIVTGCALGAPELIQIYAIRGVVGAYTSVSVIAPRLCMYKPLLELPLKLPPVMVTAPVPAELLIDRLVIDHYYEHSTC